MIRTSNINGRQLVQEKKEFKGSSTFGEELDGVYKVYSYGYHFPIYAFKDGIWYKNIDRYSQSTSKHQSQLCPSVDCIGIDTEAIKAL